MIIDYGPVPCRQNVGKPADTGHGQDGADAGLLDAGGRVETLVGHIRTGGASRCLTSGSQAQGSPDLHLGKGCERNWAAVHRRGKSCQGPMLPKTACSAGHGCAPERSLLLVNCGFRAWRDGLLAGVCLGRSFAGESGSGLSEEPAVRVWGRSRWSQSRALVALPDPLMCGRRRGAGGRPRR
jgi:hypothetical protein